MVFPAPPEPRAPRPGRGASGRGAPAGSWCGHKGGKNPSSDVLEPQSGEGKGGRGLPLGKSPLFSPPGAFPRLLSPGRKQSKRRPLPSPSAQLPSAVKNEQLHEETGKIRVSASCPHPQATRTRWAKTGFFTKKKKKTESKSHGAAAQDHRVWQRHQNERFWTSSAPKHLGKHRLEPPVLETGGGRFSSKFIPLSNLFAEDFRCTEKKRINYRTGTLFRSFRYSKGALQSPKTSRELN